MKRILIFSACSIFCLISLISCNQTPKDVTGVWSFKTLEGGYGEIWMTDSLLATIRPPQEKVFLFNYHLTNDSVLIYELGQNNMPLDGFLISQWQEDRLLIKQDSVENELKRIDEASPEIVNDLEFRKKMESDYKNRLNAHNDQ